MTRPQKQTVDYFPHDAGASDGDTINVLQSCWGNDGYAFWFKLLEKLAGSEGHFIDCRNTEKWQLFLGKTRVDPVAGEAIMRKLADLGAIDPDLWRIHRVIWCQHFVDNIADVYKNRRRLIPQKPIISTTNLQVASCRMSVETPIPLVEKRITTGDNPQSKLKETKLKESKEENKGNIFSLFEKTFKEMAPSGCTQEMSLAEKEYPEKWIYDAFEIAGAKGKHTWPYVLGILKTWLKEGRVAKEGIGGKVGRPDKTDGWKDWAEFASPGDAPESLRQQAREA